MLPLPASNTTVRNKARGLIDQILDRVNEQLEDFEMQGVRRLPRMDSEERACANAVISIYNAVNDEIASTPSAPPEAAAARDTVNFDLITEEQLRKLFEAEKLLRLS